VASQNAKACSARILQQYLARSNPAFWRGFLWSYGSDSGMCFVPVPS
jgi:hypothetical protein